MDANLANLIAMNFIKEQYPHYRIGNIDCKGGKMNQETKTRKINT